MLVIFALSIVPTAFAERGEAGESQESQNREKRIEIVKEKADERMEQAQEKVRENLKKNLKEAKTRYEEAKEALKEKKERLSELKQKARCTEESEDCRSKKLDLKRGVREHLIKTIELIDRSLAKLKEQVDNSKVLTEEEKQDALQRIAELEKQLTDKKAELEGLADSMSNEELRTQIKELKYLWHTVRKEQRWIVTQLINAKQDNMVNIYVRYGERAEAQITKLEEQGAMVTQLEELFAKYRESVEELKVAQGEANAAWLEAKSSPEALEQARELQQAFRQKAKETKMVLRKLLQEIKEVQQEVREVSGEEGKETERVAEAPSENQQAAATGETATENAEPTTAE